MGTVVALASQGGVVIAGDRRAVDEGTVTSRRVQRVVETDTVGAGVLGETGDIQTFRRELEGELRRVRIEHDGEVGIDRLARIAARLARRSNVAAVIGGRDSDGSARLREVRPDGGVFDRTAVALGDGAELAAGQLETVESGLDIDATATAVTEVLGRVADRDAGSGGGIDLWSLPHAQGSENSSDTQSDSHGCQ